MTNASSTATVTRKHTSTSTVTTLVGTIVDDATVTVDGDVPVDGISGAASTSTVTRKYTSSASVSGG